MTISKIIKISFLIFLDFAVYILCGLFLMGYDDFYDERQGEYFSLSSMENKFKIVYIFLNLWNILNCLILLYILFKIYKKFILKRF